MFDDIAGIKGYSSQLICLWLLKGGGGEKGEQGSNARQQWKVHHTSTPGIRTG